MLIAFLSGPTFAAELNLLAIGDMGFLAPDRRTPDQALVAKAMADYARKSLCRFDATLVAGDSFKWRPGDAERIIEEGFERMYDRRALDMPFYAILGNHDYEYEMAKPEWAYAARHPQSRWKMPGKWYRIDLPPENPLVTVIMLDSNNTGSSEWKKQLQWADQQLLNLPGRDRPWTICCAHTPLFSDGQHGDSKSRQADLGSILRRHRVDFYICGHDHVLEHLQPKGWSTTFLINGGGGENIHRYVGKSRGLFLKASLGFMHLQFDSNRARVTILDEQLHTLHEFDRNRAGEIHVIRTEPQPSHD